MLPLSHPKSAFHVSGNLQTVSHPGAPMNLCLSLSRSHAALAAWFSGSLSLSDMTVGKVSHFYAISGTERSLGQRDTFLSAGDSQYPHSVAGRLRVGSGMSWEPLSDSPLGYILRNGKILTL